MAPPNNRHLDEEEMEQYAMRLLPEEAVARFEEHLLLCESCRQRQEETESYVDAMRRAASRVRDGKDGHEI